MVHAPCTDVNTLFYAAGDTSCVDETWIRIRDEIARRPGQKGREATWLAEKIGGTIQQVNNWKDRGVPSKALPDIAAALGWSVDTVLGNEPPPADPWPFESVPRARFDKLTERQKGMLERDMLDALERIEAASSAPSEKRLVGGRQ